MINNSTWSANGNNLLNDSIFPSYNFSNNYTLTTQIPLNVSNVGPTTISSTATKTVSFPQYVPLNSTEKFVATSFTALIIFFAISGNFLVFLAFVKYRKLRTVTNYFILNLAATDTLVGVLPMPFWITSLLIGWPSHSDGFWYHLWIGLDVMCAVASIMSLAFISIDRYVCIKQPLHYIRIMTPKRACLYLVFIWIYALTSGILAFFDKDSEYWFEYFILIWSYILPVSIMVYCYVNIFMISQKHTSKLRNQQPIGIYIEKPTADGTVNVGFEEGKTQNRIQPSSSIQDDLKNQQDILSISKRNFHALNSADIGLDLTGWGNTTYNNGWRSGKYVLTNPKSGESSQASPQPSCILEKYLNNVKTKRMKIELKAARTLSLIMGTFLICWTPFLAIIMISVWRGELLTIRLSIFAKCFHYSNSGINPFLYSILNRNIRFAFGKLLCCACRK